MRKKLLDDSERILDAIKDTLAVESGPYCSLPQSSLPESAEVTDGSRR